MRTDVTIHPLTPDDLPFAQTVRRLAGWNQTDRDWRRLLDTDPEGCFLARLDGQPAGTATTTSYGSDLAWIGMVLVHPDLRRRNVATTLMDHCLRHLLERKAVRCVKLDATPAGRAVYEKLGFQVESQISRWEGETMPGDEIGPGGHFALETIRDLDRRAFGADHGDFLNRLAAGSLRAQVSENGFGMIREGSNATYLGPVTADSVAGGISLVRSLLRTRQNGPVFWDIPEDNRPAVRLAESLGFRRQRPLFRMWTGPENVTSDPSLQWAISGLETG